MEARSVDTVKVVTRWISVFPAWIVGYLLGNLLFALTSCAPGNEVARDLLLRDGLAGHVIMGPLMLSMKSVGSMCIGMYFAVRVAPSSKRETAFVLASALATVSAIGLLVSFVVWKHERMYGEDLARTICETVPGLAAGFIFAASVKHGATDEDVRNMLS